MFGQGMRAFEALKVFMRVQTIEGHVPDFIGDTHDALLTWVDKDAGVMDPFDMLRRLTFQLMLRVVCSDEVANHKELRARHLGEGAWAGFEGKTDGIAHGSWLSREPYDQMMSIMRQRAQRSRRSLRIEGKWPRRRKEDQDILHKMMKERLDRQSITNAITTIVVSSLEEIGSPAAWNLYFIASNPPWYEHIRDEVDKGIAKAREHDSEHPADVCRRMTYKDWGSRFPSLNLATNDTLRVSHIMLTEKRRKLDCDTLPGQKKPEARKLTPSKEFLNDLRWDPGTYQRGAQGLSVLPNTPSEDPRVAVNPIPDKLLVLMTTVMFVAHYDFTLCDAKGVPIRSPRLDLANLDPEMPGGIYFNCKLRIPSIVSEEDNADGKDGDDEEKKEQKTPKQQKRQRKKK